MNDEALESFLNSLQQNLNFSKFLEGAFISQEKFFSIAQELRVPPEGYNSITPLFERLAEVKLTPDFIMSKKETIMLFKDTIEKEYRPEIMRALDIFSNDTNSHSLSDLNEVNKKSCGVKFHVLKGSNISQFRPSFRTDCIRKKIKSLFHKHLITSLNKLASRTAKKANFKPLSKHLKIINSVQDNKLWASMSLKELLTCRQLPKTKFEVSNFIHNQTSLKATETSSIINEFLSKKWETLFKEFLSSIEFKRILTYFELQSRTYASRLKVLAFDLLNFINHKSNF